MIFGKDTQTRNGSNLRRHSGRGRLCDVRFGSLADMRSAKSHVRFEELLEVCHRHHGSNRVGNETILVGGMVHFIELFRIGFSVAAPSNLWA